MLTNDSAMAGGLATHQACVHPKNSKTLGNRDNPGAQHLRVLHRRWLRIYSYSARFRLDRARGRSSSFASR